MKTRNLLIALVSTLLFISTTAAYAEDVVLTRDEQIAEFQAKYDPLYDAQYARLVVVRGKILNDASMLPSFKLVMADFLGVRKFLDESIVSPTSDLDSVIAYADEELGEFENTLYLLQKQLATHKTITCIKGKTIKKVMALKPVCPKGYKKK
ncbi:unannotated protein [freshwater metagenome]|uniref:Unannotated protein n=1 Tax=freshwater metagenome TaxID=449393 RepID=A0A6J7HWY5_9ZZZZ|nr:hypothetical protein [Actinomycetota bacterium]